MKIYEKDLINHSMFKSPVRFEGHKSALDQITSQIEIQCSPNQLNGLEISSIPLPMFALYLENNAK